MPQNETLLNEVNNCKKNSWNSHEEKNDTVITYAVTLTLKMNIGQKKKYADVAKSYVTRAAIIQQQTAVAQQIRVFMMIFLNNQQPHASPAQMWTTPSESPFPVTRSSYTPQYLPNNA